MCSCQVPGNPIFSCFWIERERHLPTPHLKKTCMGRRKQTSIDLARDANYSNFIFHTENNTFRSWRVTYSPRSTFFLTSLIKSKAPRPFSLVTVPPENLNLGLTILSRNLLFIVIENNGPDWSGVLQSPVGTAFSLQSEWTVLLLLAKILRDVRPVAEFHKPSCPLYWSITNGFFISFTCL